MTTRFRTTPAFYRRAAGCRIALLGALALCLAPPAGADDSEFFTNAVSPNVLLLIDSSGSMREVMYHPDFSSADSTCAIFDRIAPNDASPSPESGSGDKDDDNGDPTPYYCDDNTNHCRFQLTSGHADFVETSTVACYDGTTEKSGYIERTFCGRTRKLYVDGEAACTGGNTWYSEWYAEWLYSPASDAHLIGNETNTSTDATKIDANDNGLDYLTGDTFPLYKRTRLPVAKQIAEEVIYQTNSSCGQGAASTCSSFTDRVRFGVAEFDGRNGGYVSAAVGDYSDNRDEIEAALDDMAANDSTPLAEALFKTYTYFMSRSTSELPKGQDGTTVFPKYEYRESDGSHSPGNEPGDPIVCPDGSTTCPCQKHFVIVISDGDPFNDHFTTDGTKTQGFDDFDDLIGDYNADGETETGYLSNGTLYLDDVAKFMQENDFRPLDSDQPGVQNIDVYTVGFNLDSATLGGALLQKTADVGSGKAFFGTQASEIRDALVSSIAEIIEKTQSFTAATVPASRTTDGNNFYSTYFLPRGNSPYWDGHLKSYKFTLNGEILTDSGQCAVGATPQSPPCPPSGVLRTDASAVWDAVEEIPLPVDRTLFVGEGSTGFGALPTPWFTAGSPVSTTMDRFLLGLEAAPATRLVEYALSLPITTSALDDLALDLVSSAAGCELGTLLGTDCVPRKNQDGTVSLLGDIFHSNPVVVGSPNARINDPSYVAFAGLHRERDRVIYAASNDGWLHGFLAGEWQTDDGGTPPTPLVPPRHDRGTGEELFGFMPSQIRQKLWELPISMNTGGARDFYGPDGTGSVADVWIGRSVSGGALSSPLSPAISTAKQVEQWRTVFIAGLRQGGSSYYALDVTDPSATVFPGYLWEFPCDGTCTTNPGSIAGLSALGGLSPADHLGQTWSEPVITRVRVAVNGQTGAHDRWVAVVGGGYDACGDPNTTAYFDTGSGQACDSSDTDSRRGRAILMIDITTGELLGAKFYSPSDVTLGAGGQLGYDELDYAFPSQPAVFDIDFDGYADVIYIGDLGGNLWKWTVKAVGDDPINNSSGDASLAQPDWPFELFFQAEHSAAPGSPSAGTHFQSFFYPPTATLKGGKLTLAFGAGERNDPNTGAVDAVTDDHNDSDNNHFFVVRDVDPFSVGSPSTLDETDLVPIELVDDGTKSCSDVGNASGFFLTGRDREKFVTNAVIFLGEVITSSFVPAPPSATSCNSSGEAFLYRFDLACGTGAYPSNPGGGNETRRTAVGGGLPTRPRVSIGDLNGGGGGGGGCTNRVVLITSDGSVQNECPGPLPSSGINLRSWRTR